MDIMEKLTILTDSAKYDAACTSSGADRPGKTVAAGCCHSFAADGRCISLLKVLMSNDCVFNCEYCVNRSSHDTKRATFTPGELSELTIQFFRRNYIEGLFLSSAVVISPDHTTELMINAISILRYRHNFWGYIHVKAIPGTSPPLIEKLGFLVDRISVNIELPSEKSLKMLAPNKSRNAILGPMKQIKNGITESKNSLVKYKNAPSFASAGQATQMIIGATEDSDYQIITLASALYDKYDLKRVFYSAYIPVVTSSLLPAVTTPPPLLREHRLYQADFLMRQYEFTSDEILSEKTPNFNPFLDPKCNWAVNNMHFFPVDVNKASLRDLLRVPGIGPTSARRIVKARREGKIGQDELKSMGVVLKRAKYFIITKDDPTGPKFTRELTARALIDPKALSFGFEQLSMFTHDPIALALPEKSSTKYSDIVSEAVEETVLCLTSKMA